MVRPLPRKQSDPKGCAGSIPVLSAKLQLIGSTNIEIGFLSYVKVVAPVSTLFRKYAFTERALRLKLI